MRIYGVFHNECNNFREKNNVDNVFAVSGAHLQETKKRLCQTNCSLLCRSRRRPEISFIPRGPTLRPCLMTEPVHEATKKPSSTSDLMRRTKTHIRHVLTHDRSHRADNWRVTNRWWPLDLFPLLAKPSLRGNDGACRGEPLKLSRRGPNRFPLNFSHSTPRRGRNRRLLQDRCGSYRASCRRKCRTRDKKLLRRRRPPPDLHTRGWWRLLATGAGLLATSVIDSTAEGPKMVADYHKRGPLYGPPSGARDYWLPPPQLTPPLALTLPASCHNNYLMPRRGDNSTRIAKGTTGIKKNILTRLWKKIQKKFFFLFYPS